MSSLAHFWLELTLQVQIHTQVHSPGYQTLSVSWYSAAIVWQSEVRTAGSLIACYLRISVPD